MAERQVENYKCIICSYRKKEAYEIRQYPVPLCHWCAGSTLSDMLSALNQEIEAAVESEPLLDCVGNDLLAFLCDLGEFAASHPHLAVVREIISTLLMNISGQNRIDYFTFTNKLPCRLKQRFITTLYYLKDMKLIDLVKDQNPDGSVIIREVTVPKDGLLQKAFTTIQASGIWEERREPNLILSIIIINGIIETLQMIAVQGFLKYGQGVTRLFVTNGKILVPKQFTAPLVFVLGQWAQEHDEFTESSINAFLYMRGFSSKDRNRIMQIIAGVSVGLSHTLYRVERVPAGTGTYEIRYMLNPKYKELRERMRVRARSGRT